MNGNFHYQTTQLHLCFKSHICLTIKIPYQRYNFQYNFRFLFPSYNTDGISSALAQHRLVYEISCLLNLNVSTYQSIDPFRHTNCFKNQIQFDYNEASYTILTLQTMSDEPFMKNYFELAIYCCWTFQSLHFFIHPKMFTPTGGPSPV